MRHRHRQARARLGEGRVGVCQVCALVLHGDGVGPAPIRAHPVGCDHAAGDLRAVGPVAAGDVVGELCGDVQVDVPAVVVVEGAEGGVVHVQLHAPGRHGLLAVGIPDVVDDERGNGPGDARVHLQVHGQGLGVQLHALHGPFREVVHLQVGGLPCAGVAPVRRAGADLHLVDELVVGAREVAGRVRQLGGVGVEPRHLGAGRRTRDVELLPRSPAIEALHVLAVPGKAVLRPVLHLYGPGVRPRQIEVIRFGTGRRLVEDALRRFDVGPGEGRVRLQEGHAHAVAPMLSRRPASRRGAGVP